jgi:hypothetical protein
MNFLDGQQKLVVSIKSASDRVNAYFWRLSGDEPNSLCRLLGMEEDELKVIFRLCKIYIGDKNNLSKKNFDFFLDLCGCEHTTFRLKKQLVWFIKIGKGNQFTLPKDMYDANGCLSCYPVEGEHYTVVRTKSQRGELPMLVHAGNKLASNEAEDVANKASNNNKKINVTPKSALYEYIAELVSEAAVNGDGKLSARSARQLDRLVVAFAQSLAKDVLQAALEKSSQLDKEGYSEYEELLSPIPMKVESAVVHSDTPVVISTTGVQVTPAPSEVVIADDVDDSGPQITEDTTIVDSFIVNIQEEILLQGLLHKRIHEKRERVFQLEHRNGRRLLVVLPPDTVTVSAFQEEANRTNWVKTMLNTPERVEGMLVHLAKLHPDFYSSVGQKRHLSIRPVALTTAETIALASLGKLSDIRMKKIKSFLHHIGKVNLELSAKEQERIDNEVYLHRTSEATFGTRLYEWSLVKGKEKKAPEQVHYWNSDLSKEVEAEADLHLQYLFASGKCKQMLE